MPFQGVASTKYKSDECINEGFFLLFIKIKRLLSKKFHRCKGTNGTELDQCILSSNDLENENELEQFHRIVYTTEVLKRGSYISNYFIELFSTLFGGKENHCRDAKKKKKLNIRVHHRCERDTCRR